MNFNDAKQQEKDKMREAMEKVVGKPASQLKALDARELARQDRIDEALYQRPTSRMAANVYNALNAIKEAAQSGNSHINFKCVIGEVDSEISDARTNYFVNLDQYELLLNILKDRGFTIEEEPFDMNRALSSSKFSVKQIKIKW
jgi:hypothetical protein